ncbi:hypothetical protein DES53_110185 [Roseimicrobium gellanilyticum]|uniref:Uncharacterized protein n=1 Tax=Roseimicrobium gellanilyticum TaxID=748857 RepID=A0A366HA39_9BACT|nr:hypothetical protein [Roseimicrobium gellanilyticum]RBP39161.1 hypothetical protein DES53_110185 [Roseimicrobium gellanilyticum]
MLHRYQLILEASGFSIPCEGHNPAAGFVCVRRTMAENEEEAGRRAIEDLLAEPKVVSMVQSTEERFGTSDSCKVRVDACFRIGWLRWTFSAIPQGFIFYEEGEEGE